MTDALRFPAEWEPQSGVLIAWPHADTDWAERLAEVEETYIALVAAITRFQPVLICVADDDIETYAEMRLRSNRIDMARVRFVSAQYDDTWLRDSGPITLKRGNGVGDVGKRNRTAVISIGFLKRFLILRNIGDFLLHRSLVRISHFHRVEQRPAGLFFHGSRTTVPELAAQQRSIERSRRIAAAHLAFMTLAGRRIVHPGAGQVVTRVTAHGITTRKTRIKP